MKAIFGLFFVLYALAPFIVVPLLAYALGNWLLLFGILFSFGGSNSRGVGVVGLLTCVAIGCWLKMGFDIHQYVTFFYFCSLWGCVMWACAEACDQKLKKGTLDNDRDMRDHLEENKAEIEAAILRDAKENPGKVHGLEELDRIIRSVPRKES